MRKEEHMKKAIENQAQNMRKDWAKTVVRLLTKQMRISIITSEEQMASNIRDKIKKISKNFMNDYDSQKHAYIYMCGFRYNPDGSAKYAVYGIFLYNKSTKVTVSHQITPYFDNVKELVKYLDNVISEPGKYVNDFLFAEGFDSYSDK